MRELTTKITTADPRQASKVGEAFTRNLKAVRAGSSPQVGVVSNFDPDHKDFITDAFKGYTMLQRQVGVSTVGTLVASGDYGRVPPGTQQGQFYSGTDGIKQKAPMRPEPGQPVIIYPVAGGTTSANLNYIKGGKIDYKRTYPTKLLIRNHRDFRFGDTSDLGGTNSYNGTSTIIVRGDVDFLTLELVNGWTQNSPLPPGMRYLELNDLLGEKFAFFHGPSQLAGYPISAFEPPPFTDINDPFTDYNTFLPHAGFISEAEQGVIRTNPKPLPSTAWYNLAEVRADDTYWTGEVFDPINWKDDYWDGLDRDPTGNSPRVDRELMAAWLEAHPGAIFH